LVSHKVKQARVWWQQRRRKSFLLRFFKKEDVPSFASPQTRDQHVILGGA
jgi:hypothetical protein